ncbi:N-acylglucosamine 2-epimerase [Agarivorans sp. Toyoura001]|uniref:AGE family epimerase/isomerase n=1 Tax=Agarivorans sp. Toyoura001 TaxID=2283141 RepID=UPI0010D4904C|nr:AGE family epimerase/isomerase [Agarivorans sp. Toyoura001]GDY26910.1 N-acylglucosamine 2-epimerase [Agarivorans sp. Toyoura001]
MLPVFRSSQFLQQHVLALSEFYQEHAIDPSGGYFQALLPSGEAQHDSVKQLVSSTRLAYIFAHVGLREQNKAFLDLAEHGFSYVENHHFDPQRQAYNWLIDGDCPIEQTNYCYGLAFVMLMYSAAVKVGRSSAKQQLAATFELMEQRFWQQEWGLYADEASADWQTVSDYRGQNANMHACEAMIAAYEATQESRYLHRAITIAQNICLRQCYSTDGLVWEHYNPQWQVDWEFNRNDPKNLYRPWGFQPGHQTEWTKLLVMLSRHHSADWLLPCAEKLFTYAMEKAWDHQYGGLYYGLAPDGSVCDDEKYFWVQAESFAAAALLATATGKQAYWTAYDSLWKYSWQQFCEAKHQPWWRVLSREGEVMDPLIASPGAKIDYHTIGACLEVLRAMQA